MGNDPSKLSQLTSPIQENEFRIYISKFGFVECASLDLLKVSIRTSTIATTVNPKKLDIVIQFDQLTLETCIDSMNSIMVYFKSFGTTIEKSIHEGLNVKIKDPKIKGSGNVMGNLYLIEEFVDEEAFLAKTTEEVDYESDDCDWQMNFDGNNKKTETITERIEICDVDVVIIEEDYLSRKLSEKLSQIRYTVVFNLSETNYEFKFSILNSTISWRLFGGMDWENASVSHREKECSMQLHLIQLNLAWLIFPISFPQSRELSLSIRDIEIIDNIKTSKWRKFLGYHTREEGMLPRETGSEMLHLKWIGYRESDSEEFKLKFHILPIRMYIDQDTIIFIVNFFHQDTSADINSPATNLSDNVFFKSCQIDPISIKVDYKAKRIDFESIKNGKYIEILNFVNLDGASLNLENVKLEGIKGWRRLFDKIISIWVPYIQRTQISSIASGVVGVKTLVNVGSGVRDLLTNPITQFQKDGRIIKGVLRH